VPSSNSKLRSLVSRKLAGLTLTDPDIRAAVNELARGDNSPEELASLLPTLALGFNADEVREFMLSVANSGSILKWPYAAVLDKHSIGGIPGNRTTLVVVPIITALGYKIPKTSSRAITSAAGTADVMETIARVDLNIEEIKAMVDDHGGCIAWGGALGLAPVDHMMLEMQRKLSIVSPALIAVSVLSKKIAAGATCALLEIPFGRGAKLPSAPSVRKLWRYFRKFGAKAGLATKILLTDAAQPIGFGVGPLLEAHDALAVLRNDRAAPADLRERSLIIAGMMLELADGRNTGRGYARAREALASGAAAKKMDEIMAAQGAPRRNVKIGSHAFEAAASREGTVTGIDIARITTIARLAGCPADQGAGLMLRKKVGDSVKLREPLYTIHSTDAVSLAQARDYATENPGYAIA